MSPHNFYIQKGFIFCTPITGSKGQLETAHDWIPFGVTVVGRPGVGLSLFDFMKNQENFIQGKIVVEIISEMLREARYSVYRYGYENTLPGLCQRSGIQMEHGSPADRKIRSMPDLVVMNEKGEVDFIEVKYRSSKENHFEFDEWLKKEVRDWPEAKLILVHPYEPIFQVSTILDFAKTGKLYPLERDKFLSVDKKLITNYAKLIKKYLVR